MNGIRIAFAAGGLILAGVGTASAQGVIVEGGYAPPAAYVVAPAPAYTVPVAPGPVYVAPPLAYVAPPRAYAAPVYPARRWHREVVVTERVPAWDVAPGVVYSGW